VLSDQKSKDTNLIRIAVFPAGIGNAELPDLAVQIAAFDLQRLGGAALVSVAMGQRLLKELGIRA
jgi:hypothetical protein